MINTWLWLIDWTNTVADDLLTDYLNFFHKQTHSFSSVSRNWMHIFSVVELFWVQWVTCVVFGKQHAIFNSMKLTHNYEKIIYDWQIIFWSMPESFRAINMTYVIICISWNMKTVINTNWKQWQQYFDSHSISTKMTQKQCIII